MSTVYAARGTRKSSRSNAYVKSGSGKITVRRSFTASMMRKLKRKKGDEFKPQKDLTTEQYFSTLKTIHAEKFIRELLVKANLDEKLDIIITCKGGGHKAQIQAARLAIAKALVKMDSELRPLISDYLTTDDRNKERHKVGLKGRRAGTQFSKR